jgi:hypothetical protein
MREWHAKAMAYSTSPEDLAEIDAFAAEMWDVIKDRVEIVQIDSEDSPSQGI